ncbi:ADP-ribosyltransferase [Tenacibaculum agarivorans]|uniref:ADP-ribosyltransferase n=1 Tax=Tenacibaculum agarivorans TaxID=1908389 RepID=UPI000A79C867|nr:ADP-ribosyltransferase [Tenacibaculum agarivorans]
MYAHEYGLRNFKHKTNFKNLVVFSDTQQNQIEETEPPSTNVYIEIEKGVESSDKWFVHLNSRLSGEYGDFYIENNPPAGEADALEYKEDEESIAFLQEHMLDLNSDDKISYYEINEKFYIRLDSSVELEEVFLDIKVKAGLEPKPQKIPSVELDAFVTLLVSGNGAKLESAFQSITDVNAHQVVLFIETSEDTNFLGTVFRIKKGKNVRTLPEVDRLTIAQVARVFGVDIATNELSTMIKEELKDKKESQFYLIASKTLSYGGNVIRWTTDEIFTGVSDGLKLISTEINDLKLNNTYWKTQIDGKENPKFDPLLPELKDDEKGVDIETQVKAIYKTYLFPITEKATKATVSILDNKIIAKLVPFNLEKVLQVIQSIPELLHDFFDAVIDNLVDLYYFINGLLVGLINSIIDFVKSFFDILAMLFDVLNGLVQSTTFFKNPGSYLSLFAENFENLVDAFVNVFTFTNLKKFLSLLASLPKVAYTAIVNLINTPINITIDPGAIGYYLGFSVGFVASEVVTFFATGGTGNVAKALQTVLKSYKAMATIPSKVAANTAKIAKNTVQFTINTFTKLWDAIIAFTKNIPKHLDTLKSLIDEFVASLQARIILVDNVAYSFVDPITALGKSFFNVARTNAWNKLKTIGVAMLKNEDGSYAFFYNGTNIAENLTKSQAEEFLKGLFSSIKNKKDEAIKRYFDVLIETLLEKRGSFKKYLEDLKNGIAKRVFEGFLTVGEEAMLKFYTTNLGYKDFNKALRGEIPMTDFFFEQEKLMNQGLDKLPNFKSEGLLYRIENLTEAQIRDVYKVGSEILNKHFTSTTYDMFAIGEAMQRRPFTVLIRIESKTGKLIEPLSTFKEEAEVLFKSKTRFLVERVTESINPIDPFGDKVKTIIIKEI